MFKGLGRTTFSPKPAGAAPPLADSSVAVIEETPAPPPLKPRELAKTPDPAVLKYETLKRQIHIQLVDRLDLNRVGEMDPTTLRTEIRSAVEHLCDTEDPDLNR
ncbi:MAG: CpaF family protein, partial [Isosphaeraceae bacterium]